MDELKLYTWIAVGGTFGLYFFPRLVGESRLDE